MLGFAVVWLAEAPFGLAALWWERRHDVSRQGYLEWLLESFLNLGAVFVFVCAAARDRYGARRARCGAGGGWWRRRYSSPSALLFTFVSPYLIPNTSSAREPTLLGRSAGARAHRGRGRGEARRSRTSTASPRRPTSMSTGFGPTRTVILWDTLLDGGFSRPEIRFVLAHEIGHLATTTP